MKQLNTIEICCGNKSFSKVAEKLGHKIWTTDILESVKPDLVGNILDDGVQWSVKQRLRSAHVAWMSPVCKWWSLAGGNTHWTEFRQPKTQGAIDGIKMMMFARWMADYCVRHNILFFIENPNGRAVWIMDNKYLKRVWYCQYGDTRAKPTNIWTNLDEWIPKTCFNNNPDCNHISAPRGAKTGTQGLKGNLARSAIPENLFYEIFDVIQARYVNQ